jgi:hypothetical protein
LKQINSGIQTLNNRIGESSSPDVQDLLNTLNARIGTSTVNDVQTLLDTLNDRIGSSQFSAGTVRGLLHDIEANTSTP